MTSRLPLLIRSAAWLPRGVRSAQQAAALPPAVRDHFYPKLGNRDIVGYGWNGYPSYIDRLEFPAPAVRFRENSKEILDLREKEKGDWHKLSLDEKKALYRSSFRLTYAEMNAPTGEWKSVLAGLLLGFSISFWLVVFIKKFVVNPNPHTITREWQEKQLELMIKQRQNPITGPAALWDYENNRWK